MQQQRQRLLNSQGTSAPIITILPRSRISLNQFHISRGFSQHSKELYLEFNRSKSTDTALENPVDAMEIDFECLKKYVWRSHCHYRNEKSSLLSISALCHNYFFLSNFKFIWSIFSVGIRKCFYTVIPQDGYFRFSEKPSIAPGNHVIQVANLMSISHFTSDILL